MPVLVPRLLIYLVPEVRPFLLLAAWNVFELHVSFCFLAADLDRFSIEVMTHGALIGIIINTLRFFRVYGRRHFSSLA